MSKFVLKFTGDLCKADGSPVADLALDLLAGTPYLEHGFFLEQRPRPGDPTYQQQVYSMQITPEHVASANAIVVSRPWVKASAFRDGAPNLVAIARAGIGYDKIDLAACTANDVVVFNSPLGMKHATASAALLFILGLSKRYPLQEKIVRTNRWDRQLEVVGDDLAGLTLGIIGFGHTGQELARLIAPFNMRMISYSPHADPAVAQQFNVTLVSSLDQLLRESDYVSLHGRLNETTRGMIGERELGLMKRTAFLVNVARGEMIDEAALVRCLKEKRIAGAGLDVFEIEPLPATSPLIALENVMLSPHFLTATTQASRATCEGFIRGIVRVAHGEIPEYVLNPDVLERPGFRRKLDRWRAVAFGTRNSP
jgi:phosphoglycerate dehydrogenase-like enzyme